MSQNIDLREKKCPKCGFTKSYDEFYKDKYKPSGRTSWCGNCIKAYKIKIYPFNIEYGVDKATRWRKNNPVKYKISYKESVEKAKKKNPELYKMKVTARWKANRIRKALLKGYCEICKVKTNDLEMHHPDYIKPLETITVCTRCHGLLHRHYVATQI